LWPRGLKNDCFHPASPLEKRPPYRRGNRDHRVVAIEGLFFEKGDFLAPPLLPPYHRPFLRGRWSRPVVYQHRRTPPARRLGGVFEPEVFVDRLSESVLPLGEYPVGRTVAIGTGGKETVCGLAFVRESCTLWEFVCLRSFETGGTFGTYGFRSNLTLIAHAERVNVWNGC